MNDNELKQLVASELVKLVSPSRAAAMKGMGLNTFKYRAGKPGGPEPVIVGEGDVYYRRDEVTAWQPIIHNKRRKK